MSRPLVPVDGNRPDWPRLVANAVNSLFRQTDATDAKVAALETATDWAALGDYVDDTAAAAGGVGVGRLYRTGSAVKVRVA